MIVLSGRCVGASYSFTRHAMIGAAAMLGLCARQFLRANSPATAPRSADQSAADAGPRAYGPWNLLDHRSDYGVGVFPEPFLVDDSDAEQNEFRIDWFHNENHGLQDNPMTVEVEHGFGLVTVEVEAHYDYTTFSSFDPATGRATHDLAQGMENVDLGARGPIYQYVSQDEFFDTTFGFGIEVGIPTNTPVSKDTRKSSPKFFNDTPIGDHASRSNRSSDIRSCSSPSDDGGGVRTFEYGMVLEIIRFTHDELPIPHVEQTIPRL